MVNSDPNAITAALANIGSGNRAAQEQLVALIYDELREMADRLMKRERKGHTLQPTAVVNEALLGLLDDRELGRITGKDRRYLFAAAGKAMQRVLIQHANRRNTQKRGGGWSRTELDGIIEWLEEQQLDKAVLNASLYEELERMNDRHAEAIRLRYLVGKTNLEVADILQVSESCVERDLRMALAWLRGRLDNMK